MSARQSPLKLDRGLNATWSKGGLMYANSVQVRIALQVKVQRAARVDRTRAAAAGIAMRITLVHALKTFDCADRGRVRKTVARRRG